MQILSIQVHFALRWLHILFGSAWIGLLVGFTLVLSHWVTHDYRGPIEPLGKLLVSYARCLMFAASVAFTCGFLLMTEKSHIVGFKMFSISWGVFILCAGLLGTQMYIHLWVTWWRHLQRAIHTATTPTELVQQAHWRRAIIASQWLLASTIPFLFSMIAANHWIVVLSEQRLLYCYVGLAFLMLTTTAGALWWSTPLTRWSILGLGAAQLSLMILVVFWAADT